MSIVTKLLIGVLLFLFLGAIGLVFYIRHLVAIEKVYIESLPGPLAFVVSQPIPELFKPQANTQPLIVISWDPNTATLSYQDEAGQQVTKIIATMDPIVIINQNPPDQPVSEALVFNALSPHWIDAFCPDDQLEMQYDESNTLTHIRNQGPRSCL
jgi:hypothetical protein